MEMSVDAVTQIPQDTLTEPVREHCLVHAQRCADNGDEQHDYGQRDEQ